MSQSLILKTYLLGVVLLSGPALAAPSDPFAATWAPVLAALNQDLSAKAPVFKNSSNDDLLALNEKELAAIEAEWQAKHPKPSKTTSKKSQKITPQEREEKNSFFHQKVGSLNQTTIDLLSKDAVNHRAETKDYSAIATQILDKVRANPIANVDAVTNYERGSDIGFCFGRALYVHHLLLKAGVKQEDLAKIFNVGQLMVQGQMWNFHVAMMVRDSKKGFLVVDPLAGKPLDYQSWIKLNADYEVKRALSRARFYVTDPRKFMVGPGAYSLEAIAASHLKPYFTDLGKTL